MPAVKKKHAVVEEKDDSEKEIEICCPEKIKESIKALKLLNQKYLEEDLKKHPLLEDTAECPIYLQVTLKKIPPKQLIRMIRVSLPHSLVTKTSEICLITGDLDKRDHKAEIEPTVLHYKDLLRKHGITRVSQVIPLRQLRTEYKTFESRRQLAAAYDLFLVDKTIAGVLPKTLGKSFFQSRKFPLQIDMKRPALKEQIDKALCKTEFSLTCRGNSYAFEVARMSMEDDAILENVKAAFEILAEKLPGNEKNIFSLYLKTAKSKAIPFYMTLDLGDDLQIKKPRRTEECKFDELSTIDNTEVQVFRSGKVIVRKLKKEPSSCRNEEEMNLNEPSSDDDMIKSDDDTHESASKKVSLKKKKRNKKALDLNETTNIEVENIQDSDEKASRKRKQGKKNMKSLKKSDKNEECKVDEFSTMDNAEAQIFRNERVRKLKKEPRSCKNEEINLNEPSSDNDMIKSEEDTHESDSKKVSLKKKKKNKKALDLNETTNNEMENEHIQDSVEKASRKRKKSKKMDDICEFNSLVKLTKRRKSVKQA